MKAIAKQISLSIDGAEYAGPEKDMREQLAGLNDAIDRHQEVWGKLPILPPDLPPLAAAQVAAYRAAGWRVVISRGIRWPEVSAQAWLDDTGARVIVMNGDPASPTWLFTFLHEVAHHVLGHCGAWSSEPTWSIEFAADAWALQMIAVLAPADLPACTIDAQRHMRGLLQPWLAQDDVYAERLPWDIIAWAGCDVPPDLQQYLPAGRVTFERGRLLMEMVALRA